MSLAEINHEECVNEEALIERARTLIEEGYTVLVIENPGGWEGYTATKPGMADSEVILLKCQSPLTGDPKIIYTKSWMDKVKTFFLFLWTWTVKITKFIANLILRYPMASALTIIVVVGAIFLSMFGQKIQIGGILGKLWGKKKPDVRNIPPENRVKEDGTPIQPGESDEGGNVQAKATQTIKDPGLFSDPDSVVIVHNDKGEVKIPLPKGVKNKDVHEVIELVPNVYEIKNNDSGVDTTSLLELLEKK